MSNIVIEPTASHHVAAAMHTLRPEDVSEWLEAGRRLGLDTNARLWLRTAIDTSVRESEVSRCAIDADTGEVLCIWGISRHPKHASTGTAWLIGTKAGQRFGMSLQREFKEEFSKLSALFTTVEAHVYSVNILHVYWLSRLGFRDVGPSDLIPGEVFRCMVSDA